MLGHERHHRVHETIDAFGTLAKFVSGSNGSEAEDRGLDTAYNDYGALHPPLYPPTIPEYYDYGAQVEECLRNEHIILEYNRESILTHHLRNTSKSTRRTEASTTTTLIFPSNNNTLKSRSMSMTMGMTTTMIMVIGHNLSSTTSAMTTVMGEYDDIMVILENDDEEEKTRQNHCIQVGRGTEPGPGEPRSPGKWGTDS